MTSHVNFIDYMLASTRNEWKFLREEEQWETRDAYPDVVFRRYGRREVFLRDAGRMTVMGYHVQHMEIGDPDDPKSITRVTYSR